MSEEDNNHIHQKEIPRESLVPEVVDQDQFTPSELAKQRIKRFFHKDRQYTGTKQIPIDWDLFERLAKIGMKPTDIAARLGVSHDTLLRRCKDHFDVTTQEAVQGLSGDRKAMLLETMWQTAITKKNTFMMVHLSRHQLGMHDRKMEVESSDEDENQFREIQFKPAIKTADGSLATEEQIKGWMDEFFDKPTSGVETADG